jgi:hypothetical protein
VPAVPDAVTLFWYFGSHLWYMWGGRASDVCQVAHARRGGASVHYAVENTGLPRTQHAHLLHSTAAPGTDPLLLGCPIVGRASRCLPHGWNMGAGGDVAVPSGGFNARRPPPVLRGQWLGRPRRSAHLPEPDGPRAAPDVVESNTPGMHTHDNGPWAPLCV